MCIKRTICDERGTKSMLSIKLFPAEYGDCILLSIGKEKQYNILIDGGLSKTYQKHIKIRNTSYKKDETENWFSYMHTYGQ